MGTIVRKTSDIESVRTFLRAAILERFGTLTAYANKEEVTLQYICNVLSGTKPIPAWMYKRFKINHVVAEHWEVTVVKPEPKVKAKKAEAQAAA